MNQNNNTNNDDTPLSLDFLVEASTILPSTTTKTTTEAHTNSIY